MPITTAQQSKLEQLDAFVVESVRDVCSTMLNWTPTLVPGTHDANPRAFELNEINGAIGFGGQLMGTIFFSCSENLVREMARVILGHDYPPGARELSDVAGEITNILAGGCKSRLCDHECPVVMSIPNVIRGTFIKAASRDVKFMLQHQFSLPMNGESFKVITIGKFEE
jgi:CheY-specific phosphatase CheX